VSIGWAGPLTGLLGGVVDYAGLFPPAALDMTTAVANYAEYLRDDAARWMLGAFVVPASRLDEFASAFATVELPDGPEWPLSVLVGTDPAADHARIAKLHKTYRVHIAAVEAKAATADAIAQTCYATGRYPLFVEIPLDPDPQMLIAAMADLGVSAKIRTGGVTPDAFPAPEHVVRFMRRCHAARVPFKATAGLHHPLRSEFRLTYASDAPIGTMYGYLNVFLAATLLPQLTDDEAIALLEERDARAIVVGREAIRWRDHAADLATITRARSRVVTSFGSCSFREPTDELKALSFSRT
jgi:hypothetical protein